MSRAFVKEQEDFEPPLELLQPAPSPHPNYITEAGLADLRARLVQAQAENDEREIRRLQSRIAAAIPVSPANQPHDRVAFGATITLADEEAREYRYRIVGEDEVNPEQGQVSWMSPLARALNGAQVGDWVTWERPAGDLDLEVRAIEYG